jgi:hypothetical protein
LIARVFRAKLEELKIELFKKQIFGAVAAYVYVIEHKKEKKDRNSLQTSFFFFLKK